MKFCTLFLSSTCALLVLSSAALAQQKVVPRPHRVSAPAADWSANISDDELSVAALHQLNRSPDYAALDNIDWANEPEMKLDEKRLAKLRAWAQGVHPDRVRRAYLDWLDYEQGNINQRRADLVLNAHVNAIGQHIAHPPGAE